MTISTTSQDNIIRWLTAAGIYFICLIAFYINIGQDMGAGYFMTALVPVVAALTLLPYATRVPLFSLPMTPNLIAGVAWCVTFPLLYTWTYAQDWYRSKICYDFLVGTAEIVLLPTLAAALFRIGHARIVAGFMGLLNIAALLIPLAQIAYYCIVWHCLTPASLMALYLTNWRESIDFIESNVGTGRALLILAALAALWFLFARAHLAFSRRMEDETTAPRMGALAALVCAASATLVIYLPQTSIATLWGDVDSYVKQTQVYSLGHDDRLASLAIDQHEALAAKAPGTVIFIIGESSSRNYMKVYTPAYSYDDTPWQSAMRADDHFLFFENVYSCWTQTVPVLQRALTEQSQYNGKEFFDSASLIDVAKKAGYETWWFSNQGRYGQYDSAITLVAKTADHAQWTDDSYNFTDKYDEALLPYLTQIDPAKNNFIVLHIMGSHIYYNNRYPESFNRFSSEDGSSSMVSMASYANSILYTDAILSQVYDYARKNLNLTAMVYFSDHGENIEISHNPDVFRFDMVRIPMWIYLSDAYQHAMPGHTRALRQHASRYFTNDLLYDTMCGLLNAPSERYDPGQDFASSTYRFTRETLCTMLGSRPLTSDPDGGAEE
ncbi:phosphoethanolamine transferase [uncultured Mitsuokella sp.]|uniref:phosphoethanolamine transferase n=1 Tax=uncultured Mitsuokella sp. TaxID=453120 RepID=UPI0026147EF1|nr:phosphoethanolamine transferase [uncultured Mitsuokella sp.]